MNAWVIFLFFVSGATGLVYEVIWARMLAHALGHTAAAQALVLAAFLGGLSLGNALLGARADRAARPLTFYGRLELGVAALGLASPWTLAAVEAFVRLGAAQGWPLLAVAVPGAAVAVGLPAALMGGTLPALARWAAPSASEVEGAVARFYYVNSAGAVAGALLAGLVLAPGLGLELSVLAAAAANLAVGAAALRLDRPPSAPAESGGDAPRALCGAPAPPWRVVWIVVAAGLSGASALAAEAGWTRLLILSMGSSIHSFSLMLAAFIAGLSAGSWLLLRWGRGLDPTLVFGLAELGAGLSLAATLPLAERLPYVFLKLRSALPPTTGGFAAHQTVEFAVCFASMLPLAACLGATLPAACRVAAREGRVGEDVGRVFSWNTMGNVAGALGALWLLPALGLAGLLRACSALSLAVGAVTVAAAQAWPARRRAGAAAAVLALGAALMALSPKWDLAALSTGAYRHRFSPGSFAQYRTAIGGAELLFHRDDPHGTVVVTRLASGVMQLRVNGKTDASTGADIGTQLLLGHVPLVLAPGAKRALVVGLGSGVTAGAVLRHPVESLEAVEISPAVVEASRLFDEHAGRPLDDPRLRLHMADAKTFLAASRGREPYDVIISEPSNPWIAGMGDLFSMEFYRDALAALSPKGLMVQWCHVYEMDDETLRLVLRTFVASFPHAALWDTGSNDILLLGSPSAFGTDFEASIRAFRKARPDLAKIRLEEPATFFSMEALDDAGLRRLAGEGRVNEDDFPLLEHRAPLALFLDARTRLVHDADQRWLGDEPASPTALARWVRSRKAPLSVDELKGLAVFHGRYGGPFHRAVMAELRRRGWAPKPPPAHAPQL